MEEDTGIRVIVYALKPQILQIILALAMTRYIILQKISFPQFLTLIDTANENSIVH